MFRTLGLALVGTVTFGGCDVTTENSNNFGSARRAALTSKGALQKGLVRYRRSSSKGTVSIYFGPENTLKAVGDIETGKKQATDFRFRRWRLSAARVTPGHHVVDLSTSQPDIEFTTMAPKPGKGPPVIRPWVFKPVNGLSGTFELWVDASSNITKTTFHVTYMGKHPDAPARKRLKYTTYGTSKGMEEVI